MTDGLAERYARTLVRYNRAVLLVLVVATLVLGAGAGDVDSGLTISSFGSDSLEAEKLDAVQRNFGGGRANTTTMQVVVRDGDALSKASLVAGLRFQRALRANATVGPTLRDGRATVGLSNLVAVAAIRRGAGGNATGGHADGSSDDRAATGPTAPPTLDEQLRALESLSEQEVATVVRAVLDPERAATGPVDPYALLPTDYEPGSATADARVLFVVQRTDGGDAVAPAVVEAQLATRAVAERTLGEGAFVFGAGIVDEEAGAATGDSFLLITPVALLVVVAVLGVAYRDPVDVALGLAGTVLVVVWMGGFMGWAGIGVTQILIAVPFLLVGLSIDYALHVVMRYREAGPELSPREGMAAGLGAVTVALAATTVTTAVGFLSNVVSPIVAIREFGLVSAAGIVSAFVVFAALLPAAKVEVEALAERVGLDRRRRAFGTAGAVNRLLGLGTAAARRAPVAVVVVALVASVGGAYAATGVDTSIDRVDFLPRDTPTWMDSLPEPFRPGDYSLRADAVYLNERFVRSNDRSTVELLVEGPVTDPQTLERLAAGREQVAASTTAVELATGEPSVEGPLALLASVAAENETVAAVVRRSDADGDGVPDRNLAAVYDALYAAAPERAATVIHREDGRYRALRASVAVRGGADTGAVTREMRAVAATVEGDTELTVTATGQPVVNELVQRGLLRTLVETFLLTLGVVLAFLTALFYRRYGTLTLGAVTMVPVVVALSWILGTMYLLDIPFNTETAVIASIAIGLGVDYAIHVSERFVHELPDAASAQEALAATVSGTGGALLASAASTASGFGVLVVALVPSLQRFGLVTGLTIVYAFVASVVVLPSLLAVWHGWVGSVEGGAIDGGVGDDDHHT